MIDYEICLTNSLDFIEFEYTLQDGTTEDAVVAIWDEFQVVLKFTDATPNGAIGQALELWLELNPRPYIVDELAIQ
ncbi:hypothetical protein [Vibrio sp. 10N.222.55.C7]|uniref:hypothetical protein n=1 Tax=Vibrio sp. 10N.222.55.C7 TaxID=3229650 RepID=UPI0035535830